MRYFLAYCSININGCISLFDMSFSITGPLVRGELIKEIRDSRKDIPKDVKIVFTGFNELTKEDFESWGKLNKKEAE